MCQAAQFAPGTEPISNVAWAGIAVVCVCGAILAAVVRKERMLTGLFVGGAVVASASLVMEWLVGKIPALQ